MAPTYSRVLGFGGHTWVARSLVASRRQSHSSFPPPCWPRAVARVAPRPRAPAPPSRPAAQASIAAEVPSAIKAAAPLQIATDASYAPNEFVDPTRQPGRAGTSSSPRTSARCSGVACTINNVTFSDIIPALAREPVEVSDELLELHPHRSPRGQRHRLRHLLPGRRGVAGEDGWPDHLDGCRHVRPHRRGRGRHHRGVRRVGIHGHEAGRRQIPGDTNHCTAAGKQDITVASFETQTQANAALLSGRADFGWAGPAGRRLPGQARGRQAQDRRHGVQRLALRRRDGEVDGARAGGPGRASST